MYICYTVLPVIVSCRPFSSQQSNSLLQSSNLFATTILGLLVDSEFLFCFHSSSNHQAIKPPSSSLLWLLHAVELSLDSILSYLIISTITYLSYDQLSTLANMKWELYSKNIIKPLLAARAPHLNARHYDAAASVFPFRNNPYVINKLIDWYDFIYFHSLTSLFTARRWPFTSWSLFSLGQMSLKTPYFASLSHSQTC